MAALQTPASLNLAPPVSRTRQPQSLGSLASPFSGSSASLRLSLSLGNAASSAAPFSVHRSGAVAVRAAGEVFELEIERPYGVKFYRGEDGGIYVDALTPGYPGAKSGKIQEGDKLLATSAVFGDEMWPAAEYGRTMYTIQQRVGPMIMRFEKRDGEKIGWFKAEAYLQERAAGNYGDAIRERQMENYVRKLELAEQRAEEVEAGLALYREGKFEDALKKFQSIMGLSPEYKEQGVAFYNIACCCSKLRQAKAGLNALEAAMSSGFDDYKKIRQDPDLSFLRDTDEFDELLSKYDEPFINENAIKALSGVFSIFGRK